MVSTPGRVEIPFTQIFAQMLPSDQYGSSGVPMTFPWFSRPKRRRLRQIISFPFMVRQIAVGDLESQ